MKKSLIALAVMAVSGAAMAQSSVEIYGFLDVGVAKVKGGKLGVNNTNYTVPFSQSSTGLANGFARSALTTSAMGFRGSEDLGGGMRATFNLQTGGLDLSTGAAALAFSREANLGLSGGFGAIKIGRSVSTICASACSFDYNYISTGSAYALIGVSPANIKASSRRSNQIEYTAPGFVKGLTVRASYIPEGDAVEDSTFSQTLGSASAGRVYKAATAIAVNYASGPLRVAYVYETANSNNTATRAAQFIGADYDFKVAKVAVSAVTNDTKGTAGTKGTTSLHSVAGSTSGKGYGISLAAPVGAATVGIQHGRNTENGTNATEVFARYSLSKRTELYSLYTTTGGTVAKTEGTTLTGSTTNAFSSAAIPAKVNLVSVGVRHVF
jgi:predicted porin